MDRLFCALVMVANQGSLELSQALLEANKRLLELRAKHAKPCSVEPSTAESQRPNHELVNGQKLLQQYRKRDGVEKPPNLPHPTPKPIKPPPPPEVEAPNSKAPRTIKHHPSIGLAALRHEEATTYRVWLMCRHLDRRGRGWLDVDSIKDKLTDSNSPLRLFSWARMRQILRKGAGRFWERNNGRLWLFSAGRVGVTLAVAKLQGKPVELPISAIVAGIGEFKAHLYAAFHSGRKSDNPISRAVQEEITAVPERTQRRYCNVARVKRQRNIAIGPVQTPENEQEQAYKRGKGCFTYFDYNGSHGRKNKEYIAWALPSSYEGPHKQSTKGRQKKINRTLKDLVNDEAQGNSSGRVFFSNGADAARAGGYWASRNVGGQWFVIAGN